MVDATPLVRCRTLEPGESWVVREVFAGLSAASRQRRFHVPVPRLTDRMVTALSAVHPDAHVVVVAETRVEGLWRPVGIARAVRAGGTEAELAVEVVDAWQRRGVGRRLLHELHARVAAIGIEVLTSSILVGNRAMLDLLLEVFPDTWLTTDGRTWEARSRVQARPRRRRLHRRRAA